MPNQDLSRRELLWLTLLIEGGLAVLAILLGWLTDVWPWQPLAWNGFDAALGFAATLPMLALFLAFLRWPVGLLRSLKQFADEVIKPLFQQCTTLDLVFISILAGLGEEMFFRGWLQPYLVQYIDTVPALLLASLLFGLFHPISLVYVLFATLFGLYLGLLLLVTDNLLPPIIAHAFYDFVALVYLAQSPPPHPGPLASSYSPPDDTLP